MLLTYAVATIIGSAWLLQMIQEKRLIWQRTPFDIPIGLFGASQILSPIFSLHPYTSFFGYYTRFHGGLLSTLTYVLFYYAFVQTMSRKTLKLFFLTTAIAAAAGML